MPVIVKGKLGKKSAKLHLTEILSDVYTKPVVHTKRLKIVPEMYEKFVKRKIKNETLQSTSAMIYEQKDFKWYPGFNPITFNFSENLNFH